MSIEEFKRFAFVSIISADNEEYTEDVKQEIISRYNKNKDLDQDWEYVLEPIQNVENRNNLIQLFRH